jgi:hypothetical protein
LTSPCCRRAPAPATARVLVRTRARVLERMWARALARAASSLSLERVAAECDGGWSTQGGMGYSENSSDGS